MKQQSHSFESVRKVRASWDQLPLQNDVIHGVRRCNIVLTHERCYKICKHMQNIPTIAGFLQCNHDGKLEEAEDFKSVFVVYCVFKSK